MTEFDKAKYWENRNAGKRGQGDEYQASEGSGTKTINRAMHRQRIASTKHSPYLTDWWKEHKQAVARKVARHEATAQAKARNKKIIIREAKESA